VWKIADQGSRVRARCPPHKCCSGARPRPPPKPSWTGPGRGTAPLGVGWVVWRSADLLPEDLVFRVCCLGGDLPTFAAGVPPPSQAVRTSSIVTGRCSARDSVHASAIQPASSASSTVHGEGRTPATTSVNAASSAR